MDAIDIIRDILKNGDELKALKETHLTNTSIMHLQGGDELEDDLNTVVYFAQLSCVVHTFRYFLYKNRYYVLKQTAVHATDDEDLVPFEFPDFTPQGEIRRAIKSRIATMDRKAFLYLVPDVISHSLAYRELGKEKNLQRFIKTRLDQRVV